MSPTPLALSAPLRSATTYAPFPAPLRSARHMLPTPLHCIPLDIRSLPHLQWFATRLLLWVVQPQAAQPTTTTTDRRRRGGIRHLKSYHYSLVVVCGVAGVPEASTGA